MLCCSTYCFPHHACSYRNPSCQNNTQIRHAKYDRKKLTALGVSLEGQDLLAKLFVVDPLRRLSASEVHLTPDT